MLHLVSAFKKLMGQKLTTQKTQTLQCPCIICLNTVKITGKQQVACGIITETNQIVVWLVVQNIQSLIQSIFKSFNYKANFIKVGVTLNNLRKNDVKIVVSLKCLSNFWRSLNILNKLINCEIELVLTWFKKFLLISKATRETNYTNNPIVRKTDNPEDAKFQIKDTK